MVYRNSSTAKARTSGARFVKRIVLAIICSSVSTGKVNDASTSCGERDSGPLMSSPSVYCFDRFDAFSRLEPGRLAVDCAAGFLSRALQAL